MQTIRIYDDRYTRLYRYGLKPENAGADWWKHNLGNDPYDRMRVIPRKEMGSLYVPLDKDFSIADGCILFEWSGVETYQNHMTRIKQFLGVRENEKDCNVEVDLKACFTVDGRVVLFKADAKPKRVEKTLTNYTKLVEEWTNQYKQWGVKNPKYVVKYWQFKRKEDYVIVTPEDRVLFTLLPNFYETTIRPMRQEIWHLSVCAGSHPCDTEEIKEQKKEYARQLTEVDLKLKELLWNTEPFSLDEPCDYTDEQKQYVQDIKDEIERKRIERELELERLKETPGHCSECGAPYANWVDDPYDYEMYGTHNKRWLCSECYHDIAMDV